MLFKSRSRDGSARFLLEKQNHAFTEDAMRGSDRRAQGDLFLQIGEMILDLPGMDLVTLGFDDQFRAAGKDEAFTAHVSQVARIANALLRNRTLVRVAVVDVIDEHLRSAETDLTRLSRRQLRAGRAVRFHRFADRKGRHGHGPADAAHASRTPKGL